MPSGDLLWAVGALLSGIGAILTGWAALRYAKRDRR